MDLLIDFWVDDLLACCLVLSFIFWTCTCFVGVVCCALCFDFGGIDVMRVVVSGWV